MACSKRLMAAIIAICLPMLAASEAEDLLAAANISTGLICFPRVQYPALVLDFANQENCLVYARCANAATADDLRNQARSAGILNINLFIDQGDDNSLGLAKRLADLMIVENCTDADASDTTLLQTWHDLLGPRRGVLLASGPGANADLAAAWPGKSRATVTVGSNTWQCLTATPPSGSDQWQQRYHAADNTQVSKDEALQAPFLTKWYSLPMHDSFWGFTMLSAGGVNYSIREHRAEPNKDAQGSITARSNASGIELWTRILDAGFNTSALDFKDRMISPSYISGRSMFAALADGIWLIDGDTIRFFDRESGEELRSIAGPTKGQQMHWLGYANGTLAVLQGAPDAIRQRLYEVIDENPSANVLAVYDAATGDLLWQETLPGPVDHREIGIQDGSLIYHAQKQAVVCRDLLNQSSIHWQQTDASILDDLAGTKSNLKGLILNQRSLVITPQAVVIGAGWTTGLSFLARDTGDLLWRYSPPVGRVVRAIADGDYWIEKSETRHLLTGEVVSDGPVLVSDSCGPATATPRFMIGGFGAVATRDINEQVRTSDVKSPCDVGLIIADGTAMSAASTCVCNLEIRGYRAFTTADGFQPHQAPTGNPVTIVDISAVTNVSQDAHDWPTTRHDMKRSSGTGVSIGTQAVELWRWNPANPRSYSFSPEKTGRRGHSRHEAEYQGTPAVVVGAYTLFGDANGTVRCIQTDDGSERWSMTTDARLFCPPTIWQGHVLIGDGLGVLHCVELISGRVLWRLQAAPAIRRMPWYGHLVNTWPIVGTPSVDDNGVAYVSAGYQPENGVHLYAIDIASGTIIWQKHDLGTGSEHGVYGTIGNYGDSCIADGRLWLAASLMVPPSFDLSDGSLTLIPNNERWTKLKRRGGMIGALADNFIITGGRRVCTTYDCWTSDDKGGGWSVYVADNAYLADTSGGIDMNERIYLMPVWDDQMMVTAADDCSDVHMWQRSDMESAFTDAFAAAPTGNSKEQPIRSTTIVEPTPLWGPEEIYLIAMALCDDALVVCRGSAFQREFQNWTLEARSRSDGSVIWSVNLPEQPVFDGLSIDRKGRALVALRDGSVVCYGPEALKPEPNPNPNNPPTADLSGSVPVSGTEPLTVQFDSSASNDSDGSIVTYAWDFGDGSSSTAASPSHQYHSNGTYTATLTITDDDGDTNSDSIDISVSPLLSMQAIAKSHAEIMLNWTLTTDLDWLLLQRKGPEPHIIMIRFLSENSSSYRDLDLDPQTDYRYELLAGLE